MCKKLLTVLALFVAMAFIMGVNQCSQSNLPDFYVDKDGNTVEITDPAEQCIIYRILGTNTKYYKVGLFTANYAALKAGVYTSEEADTELTFIEKEVNNSASTVGSVVQAIIMAGSKAAKVGAPEIILVTEGLADLKMNTTPIDQCTRYKLNAYIGSQRRLIYAFKE